MAFEFQSGVDDTADQGLLSEHEAGIRKEDPKTGETMMLSEAQEKIVRMVEKTFKKHKKHREKYDKNWLENYKIFRGDQWKNKRPSYRHSEVINLVFQAIQSTVPMQTDARPKFEFLPP